jgi:hypothetical protein
VPRVHFLWFGLAESGTLTATLPVSMSAAVTVAAAAAVTVREASCFGADLSVTVFGGTFVGEDSFSGNVKKQQIFFP